MHRKLYASYSEPQLDLKPIGTQLERRPLPEIGHDRGFKRTFNPLAQVQFGEGAFSEFGKPLLVTTAFEDEDENEVPHENARKRSWKRTAGPLARP